MKSLMIPYH